MGENSFATKYLSEKFGLMFFKGEFVDSFGNTHATGTSLILSPKTNKQTINSVLMLTYTAGAKHVI